MVEAIYYLGQNPLRSRAVVTTSTALATIAFWFYDIFCRATHPYVASGFLILPGILYSVYC